MSLTKQKSLNIPYKSKEDGQVISPSEWNADFNHIQNIGNENKGYFNDLIDALESSTDGSSGADKIGATGIEGITGATIQAILEGLKALVDDRYTKDSADDLLDAKANNSLVANHIKTVSYDSTNGNFTFTTEGGTVTTIDTMLEKIITNFAYDDETQSIIFTASDGTTSSVSIADFITINEFNDSDQIDFTITDGVVTATIKNGSITSDMLASTVMSAIIGYKNAAATSASNASASEANALTHKNNAASSASTASTKADEASSASTTAQTNASTAVTKAQEASASASAAATSAGEASTSASNALDSYGLANVAKQDAVTAKEAAETAKTDAITAKNAAETAKTNAETAETNAETAETNAATSEANALSYKEAAETAKSDAITAKNAAETAKTNAETAETNAETAETNAESSAEDSEAWAKGTRNGVDVASTDPAYHNNSKYYKDQAAEIVGGDYATVSYVDDAVAGKAATNHTHEIANVNGLQDALDTKDELFVITAEYQSGVGYITYYFDKTNAEIFAAIDAGKTCIIKDDFRNGVWYRINLYTSGSYRYAAFMHIQFNPFNSRFVEHVLTFKEINEDNSTYYTGSTEYAFYDVVRNTEYTKTIGTNWEGTSAPYTQEVSVNGLSYLDDPMVFLIETTQSDELEAAWANIYHIETDSNYITVYSKEPTTVNIPIRIKVVR